MVDFVLDSLGDAAFELAFVAAHEGVLVEDANLLVASSLACRCASISLRTMSEIVSQNRVFTIIGIIQPGLLSSETHALSSHSDYALRKGLFKLLLGFDALIKEL